jgi:GDP-L-fucose synthase
MTNTSDFYKGQNILVTGGTGLIGVPLVEKLIKLGANLHVVSMETQARASELIPELDDTLDALVFTQADLRNRSVCEELCEGVDMVFHLAGTKGSVSLGRSRAASFFTPMLQFNTNMMDAAHKAGVERYLYTSSIGVYPEASIFHEDDAWKGDPFSVDKFAGWAKRMGELQAQAYRDEFGWDKIAIVRPANVYGRHDNFDPATGMVVSSLIGKFLKKHKEDTLAPVEVWGDGAPIRDFIYADDVADGMLLAMEYGADCTPLNLGNGTGVTIRKLAETISNLFGYTPRTLQYNVSKPTGESMRIMDISRAQGKIGFAPSTSLEEGLRRTITYAQDNYSLSTGATGRYNVFTEQTQDKAR